MNHLQQTHLDRFSEEHGRVAVRERYKDEHVELTAPSGYCIFVSSYGIRHDLAADFSHNWSYDA